MREITTKLNKYTCIRCREFFQIEHEVDEGAVCNRCFELVKASKTGTEYYTNITPTK